MLYKNDEPYKLTQKDTEKLEKFIGGRYPAVVKIPETMYVKAKNRNGATVKVRPPRMNIPLQEIRFEDGIGTVKWNYCKAPPTKNKETSEWEYHTNGNRSHLSITGMFALGKDQVDLLYFLTFLSKWRALGDGEAGTQVNKGMFKIENKEKEAIAKNAFRQKRFQVENAIYNPTVNMLDLRKWAKAFFIDSVDEMSDPEVQAALMGRVEGMKNGYDVFIEQVELKGRVEIQAAIQDAIEKNKIRFYETTHTWNVVTDGKKGQEIAGILSGRTNLESLIETIEQNPKLLRALVDEVAVK